MNLFIIIGCVAVVTVAALYFLSKNAHEVKQEEPKFQPRKMSYIPKKDVIDSMDKPKRKKKKYYNKKKPTVANNAPIEKRPVGRPKKSN
jgi:hypothetical protein